MSIKELEKYKDYNCACGRIHTLSSKIVTGENILKDIPSLCDEYSSKNIYVICDKNTFKAAGEKVINILKEADKSVSFYMYTEEKVVPDETSVGRAIMHYPQECDLVIGVGSGVINDISKIVAKVSEKPYFIVATAPSMDGYASATSSMDRDGVKATLKSKIPDVIIGDTLILSSASMKAIVSGLGNMIAKYVALCEWHIASITVGEYYCEELAQLVRIALKKCVDNAEKLLERDKEAVKAVFEGLVICGAAMAYAGVSRPASGEEHYISHIIDMRAVSLKTPDDTHGNQCAIGTLYALKLYEKLKTITPDKEKALNFVKNYNYSEHAEFLRKFLGDSAETLIALEEREGKYSPEKHKKRLEIILEKWDAILEIINELPSYGEVLNMWKKIGGPATLKEIGIDNSLFPEIFIATKDIRDKYVLSFLAWDLGVTDTLLENI